MKSPAAAGTSNGAPGGSKRGGRVNSKKKRVMQREEKVKVEDSKTSSKETMKRKKDDRGKVEDTNKTSTSSKEKAKAKVEDRKTSSKETMKRKEDDRGKVEDTNKTSLKDMLKGREEERVTHEEKRRRTAGKQEEKEEDGGSGPGFIFMCNSKTKPECYQNGVFGLPRGKMNIVEKIRPGSKLFLYDFDLKLMYGVYKAKGRGGMDLVRHAFDGKFPAQVKFCVDVDCLPIRESSFKHAIKENYDLKGRFTQELSSKQVHRLLALFKPIDPSQPTPQHIEEMHHPCVVEDRQRPYHYDERQPSQYVEHRGAPINVHAYPLEDHLETARSLRLPPFNEPRHSLLQYPHQVPIDLESRQAPIALGTHHAPPMYYQQVAPNSSYHQPHIDPLHEKAAAEATVRDPLFARDYKALPGELAVRTERLDELYRSYKLSTRSMDLHMDPSYVTTSYEESRSVYSEGLQRPVSTRVSMPNVPVSTRYSFPGPI